MTAQQFLESKGDADFKLSKSGEFISDIMIEFAQFHVEQALKEAVGCVNIYDYAENKDYSKFLDKKSILNAYPLDKIK